MRNKIDTIMYYVYLLKLLEDFHFSYALLSYIKKFDSRERPSTSKTAVIQAIFYILKIECR